MQKKEQSGMEVNQIRHFSTVFKVEKVQLIEKKIISVSDVCREYKVSPSAVYKWIDKYSTYIKKAERIVVEKESEETKNKVLRTRIADLERLLGQKEVALVYLEQIIQVASEDLGVDIKKKHSGQQ